jgi:3-methyladenine DNA glycosylase AlkD
MPSSQKKKSEVRKSPLCPYGKKHMSGDAIVRRNTSSNYSEYSMASTADVLRKLKQNANSASLTGMAKFGMAVQNRLGVSMPDIRRIAREVGRDHTLALALWKTGIAEARIVASIIADPDRMTQKQAEQWVKTFDSWDVCDQICQNLFNKTSWAWQKVRAWATRDEEFVKRAAFALLACLAWRDKQAADNRFIALFPVLRNGARDDRNFVKKAVNWALRNIGKRNRRLNKEALKLAEEIWRVNSRAARWIAADAVRELESSAVQRKFQKQRNGQKPSGHVAPSQKRHPRN